MNFLKVEVPKRIGVFGDWHGEAYWARTIIDYANCYNIDIALHVGDFGYWTWKKEDDKKPGTYINTLQNKLEELGLELWWVDGNHEYFPAFSNFLVMPDGRMKVTDNIYYIPRGHRWEWDGNVWLGLGGAVSVDRDKRRKWVDWFPDETITETQKQQVLKDGTADVMITHEAPPSKMLQKFLNSNGGTNWFQKELLDLSDNHQKMMGEIVATVQPKHLFHGHYHYRYDTVVNNVTNVHGLDRDGNNWNKERNFLIVDNAGNILVNPFEEQQELKRQQKELEQNDFF